MVAGGIAGFWSSFIFWQTHAQCFESCQLSSAYLQLLGHLIVLCTLSQSFEAIIDTTLEVVLDTSIAGFVLVSRTGDNVAPKLTRVSVYSLTHRHNDPAKHATPCYHWLAAGRTYLLLATVVARSLHARLVSRLVAIETLLWAPRATSANSSVLVVSVAILGGMLAALSLPRMLFASGGRRGRRGLLRRHQACSWWVEGGSAVPGHLASASRMLFDAPVSGGEEVCCDFAENLQPGL